MMSRCNAIECILIADPFATAFISVTLPRQKKLLSIIHLLLNSGVIRPNILIKIKSIAPKIAYCFLCLFPSTEMKDEC